MKVLVFAPQFHQVGGSERLSVELAIELNRVGIIADMLSQYANVTPNTLEAEAVLKASGIPEVNYLGLDIKPGVGSFFSAIRRFRRLLLDNRYDAVEVSGFSPSLIAVVGSFGTGKRVLFGVHAQYHRCRNSGFRYFLWRNLIRFSTNVRFYAISKAVAQDWIVYSKTSAARTAVVLNSINDVFFSSRSSTFSRENVRKRMAVNPGSVVVLFVGRLVKSKGIDTVFDAAKPILERNENYHFVFAGRTDDSEGPENAVLVRNIKFECSQARWGNRVHFVGECSDVRELMAGCDLLVHPARLEGFGLTLAEALAVGVRVVASNVGGIPEVLAGTHSMMIRPDDSDALRDAILSVLAWPNEKVEEAIRLGKSRAEGFRVQIRARSILKLLAP
jgi:glycosyltransferase involved in cell wall biosynthesis